MDLDNALWTVPAERMKAEKVHRVPLSRAAVEILRGAQEASEPGGYVFPGLRPGRPLSTMTMEMLLRRMGVGQIHGPWVPVELSFWPNGGDFSRTLKTQKRQNSAEN